MAVVTTIPVKHGLILLDPESYDLVKEYKWTSWQSSPEKPIYAVGKKSGTKKLVYLHRLLKGFPAGKVVDHKNGNGLDNRLKNLRVCYSGQNNMNQKKTRGSSRFKGVSWSKTRDKWRAEIAIHRKTTVIGYFEDEVEAARAYNFQALKIHGEFAKINEGV